MNPTPFTAVGVDVGGTKIAAGIVTFPGGTVHARRHRPTLPQRGGEAVLGEVARLVSELAAEADGIGLRIGAIGVGICELVDRTGEIVSASCLDWSSARVRERLSLVAPTILEADVRAAARAEALFGAGRGAQVFLYVSIGTGIANCLVLDGQPFIGARGVSGTLASGPLPGGIEMLSVNPSSIADPAAAANSRMTLEQIAAGPALVTRFQQLGGRAESGEDVLRAAAEGDDRALHVVETAAEALGGSIGWLVNVLDPELVILGGGLGRTTGRFREGVIAAARRHIWWGGHRELPIVPAATGADAGLMGAAAIAWQRFAV